MFFSGEQYNKLREWTNGTSLGLKIMWISIIVLILSVFKSSQVEYFVGFFKENTQQQQGHILCHHDHHNTYLLYITLYIFTLFFHPSDMWVSEQVGNYNEVTTSTSISCRWKKSMYFVCKFLYCILYSGTRFYKSFNVVSIGSSCLSRPTNVIFIKYESIYHAWPQWSVALIALRMIIIMFHNLFHTSKSTKI